MATKTGAVWGMHAGRTGDADALFLKSQHIGLGWAEVGDLSKLTPDREAFKARVTDCYRAWKPGAVRVGAGQLYRFVHEMQVGDLVIYPSKQDRQVHIGWVSGSYSYQPGLEPGYPNRRSVEWLRSLPRTHFSQGALYEIGSAMSLFQVRNFAEEFRDALESPAPPPPVEEDETVAVMAQEIEQTTRDFVLKRLAQELKGHPFAEFVAHELGTMGYRTRVSPPGPDSGIDIIAHKDELGFEPPIIKVQVKSTEGSTGDPVVSSLYGKVGAGEYGLLVALGTFTPAAQNFARSKSNLRLIDGDELVTLVLEHYEQFDSRYKGLLPLRRVYVPQVLEEADG